MKLRLSARMIACIHCTVCGLTINTEQVIEDRQAVALFGAIAYAQCCCCKQLVHDLIDDVSYRGRYRLFLIRKQGRGKIIAGVG